METSIKSTNALILANGNTFSENALKQLYINEDNEITFPEIVGENQVIKKIIDDSDLFIFVLSQTGVDAPDFTILKNTATVGDEDISSDYVNPGKYTLVFPEDTFLDKKVDVLIGSNKPGIIFSAQVNRDNQTINVNTYSVIDNQQTSGELVIGEDYIIDEILSTEDDFTNVGFVKLATPFIASGTTPTSWTGETIVTNVTTQDSGELIIGQDYEIAEVLTDDFDNVGFVAINTPFEATGTTPTTWLAGTKVVGADSQTSGELIVGQTYLIETLEVRDNFSNVGYVSEGIPFEATGTTPTTYVNSTVVNFVTELTSGDLIVGKDYQIDEILGDDFTNVGFVAINTPFEATGTTPTTWTNSTIVTNVTTQTSGVLIIGQTYEIAELLTNTDNFDNVGFVEVGEYFYATGTTPTNWVNSTVVSNDVPGYFDGKLDETALIVKKYSTGINTPPELILHRN